MAAVAISARMWWRHLWGVSRRRSLSNFSRARIEEEKHAEQTMVTWRYISLLVALPSCALVAYSAVTKEMAHKKHIEEHGKPKFIAYSHLRLRLKPFPWGDGNHSLIHNPHVNALPDGYEDEE